MWSFSGPGRRGRTRRRPAALLGKSVAVVETAAVVGGAAVNTGTLPSKTLRETALALSGLRSRDLYGVDLSLRRGATIDDFLRHERAVKSAERDQLRDRLDRYGVRIFRGTAAFADPHTVRFKDPAGTETLLRGDKIVIAIGSSPVRPPGIPFEHACVHDSDELIDLHELPKSIAVVGAGVIGSEYACMFAALGVPTYLIDGREQLLPFLDPDLSAALQKAMTDLGVRFIWKERVTACAPPADGDVVLTLSSGRQLAVDHVLFCAGRASRTADLNLAAAGIAVAEKGRVPVNASLPDEGAAHLRRRGRDRVPGPGLDQRRAGAGGRLPRLRQYVPDGDVGGPADRHLHDPGSELRRARRSRRCGKRGSSTSSAGRTTPRRRGARSSATGPAS